MPLESVTYISDLIATNPVNATDQVAQGDDHIRNIKLALLNTFPAITGAVTPTHTAINQTCVGTGGTFPAINGSNLTALNATNLASGTVADARLSSNVAKLNAAAPFTGGNLSTTFSVDGNGSIFVQNNSTGTAAIAQLAAFNSDSVGLRIQIPGPNNVTSPVTGGAAVPTIFTDAAVGLVFGTNSVARYIIGSTGNHDFKSGTATFGGALTVSAGGAAITGNSSITGTLGGLTGLTVASGGASITGNSTITGTLNVTGDLTTPNASASEVGFKGAPQNVQNGNYTLVLTDAGKSIVKQSGGAGATITIPANASVAFPPGTVVLISNKGGGTLSVAITTDTLSLGGTTTTGTRTLVDGALATLYKDSATSWTISGAGVS